MEDSSFFGRSDAGNTHGSAEDYMAHGSSGHVSMETVEIIGCTSTGKTESGLCHDKICIYNRLVLVNKKNQIIYQKAKDSSLVDTQRHGLGSLERS